MKRYTKSAVLISLVLSIGNGNAQWKDNFSDGDLKTNPEWSGDTSKFKVNASGMLQLNALSTDNSVQLSVKSQISLKAEWKFKVQMDFNPSSTSYSNIYLMSDTSDFRIPWNGYFIRVGHTADNICLFKQTGVTSTLLISGREKMLNTSTVNTRIKVTRDSIHRWELFCDTTGNDHYIKLGSIQDSSVLSSGYFGLQCIFIASRIKSIYFDDFEVSGDIYIPPPPIKYIDPELYDIVFNEIMADPTPPGLLPEAEYLELFNCSDTNFSTHNWKLKIGTTSYKLPDTLFKAGEFLVLTAKASASDFSNWCKPLGIFTSSTILTNTGQYLELRDRNDSLITWLEYSDTWYADDFKAEGGWSLEQMDPSRPCGGSINWKASIHKNGGTPGSKNSIYQQNPDNIPPHLKHIQVSNDSCIRLYFNEPLNHAATSTENFSLGANLVKPLHSFFYRNGFSILNLQFPTKLSQTTTSVLKISDEVSDCATNKLEREIDTLVIEPRYADSTDVIINEVLFDSKPYCPDYIEVYNRSAKVLNTADLLLCINDGTSDKTFHLTTDGFLFYPGTYLLLSSNPEILGDFYNLNNEYSMTTISDMTSLNDEEGKIILKTLDYKIIDAFTYNKQMHLGTLRDTEGISLERINPDMPSYLSVNWHSASETSGYGTPGYQNSQYNTEPNKEKPYTTENEIFSPDNDGFNDVLAIQYRMNKPNSRISAWVYDLNGRKIKELLNNVLPDASGTFYWDGFSDKGKLCAVGMYLILIQTVYEQGNSEEYKLPCVLAIKK